ADGVDAVDRENDEDASGRAVRQADRVAIAGSAGDIAARAMTPGREGLSAAAVDDLKVDQRADGRGGRRGAGARCSGGEEGEQSASSGHGGPREEGMTAVERTARPNR